LDLALCSAQHGSLSEDTIQYLVLDRCDPTCNMARYYVLSIETSPFGDASLICEWGASANLVSSVRSGLSFTKPSQRPWKPSIPGSGESADVATRSEMCRRIAVIDAGRGA
jgi:hypothetical protein